MYLARQKLSSCTCTRMHQLYVDMKCAQPLVLWTVCTVYGAHVCACADPVVFMDPDVSAFG